MLILAAWVLLSFIVAAIWAAEGFGGPLDDAMTPASRAVKLTWDVRWAWFILLPVTLLLAFGIRAAQIILREEDDGVSIRDVPWDLWQVIVLGRRPLLRD